MVQNSARVRLNASNFLRPSVNRPAGGLMVQYAQRACTLCYNRGAGWAHVAQAAERVLGKDKVTGSNPVVGSRKHPPVLCCDGDLSAQR